jgi:hypothetical protein
VQAILLNRTQFYASSRERLQLRRPVLFALYSIPIGAFLAQTLIMLQALKCQTSPDYPLLRYGDPAKLPAIDFGADGGFLYALSSNLLFWQDDATCCAARGMLFDPSDQDPVARQGSLALLYWFFITLCIGQFFETLSCALQGRQPVPETGMTIFEHSLAFAECEAMLSNALGFGFFGLPKLEGSGSQATLGATAFTLMTRADVFQRLNVPPEVLLVCLISCFSHLSSAILAVTKLRDRVRLINTAIWATCYMSAFFWSFSKIFSMPSNHIAEIGVLRFPTVCMVGFIPHLLILVGILVCAFIYGLAMLVTASSIPATAVEGLTFRQRLAWAYNNLQANVHFSSNPVIRIKLSEDFYTTLLKVGFNVLTAASEAVYLNEGSRIQVSQMTWLEQKRIDQMASNIEQRQRALIPSQLLDDGIARGIGYTDQQNAAFSQSPYARERKSRPTKPKDETANSPDTDTGVGLAQRRSRMQLTTDFVEGIFWLLIRLQARLILFALRSLGIEYRPALLLKAAGLGEGQQNSAQQHSVDASEPGLEFYLIDTDGQFNLPVDTNVDVEDEMRQRQHRAGTFQDEEKFSDSIYRWWQQGGWFGDIDTSGEYEARELEDDETSIITTNDSDVDPWEDEDERGDEGRRTPTQDHPYPSRSRDGTPVPDAGMDFRSLARLLDPQTAADREEARLLAHSLNMTRPLTRNQYQRDVQRKSTELLSGLRSSGQPRLQPLTEEEEEHDLEGFLLAQRAAARARAQRSGGGTWESGAEGMGAGGPQCVVCQSTPRTILVWPCGCLSMCDECRVGLAARNYTKCICCRTDIAAYSRLYVP